MTSLPMAIVHSLREAMTLVDFGWWNGCHNCGAHKDEIDNIEVDEGEDLEVQRFLCAMGRLTLYGGGGQWLCADCFKDEYEHSEGHPATDEEVAGRFGKEAAIVCVTPDEIDDDEEIYEEVGEEEMYRVPYNPYLCLVCETIFTKPLPFTDGGGHFCKECASTMPGAYKVEN